MEEKILIQGEKVISEKHLKLMLFALGGISMAIGIILEILWLLGDVLFYGIFFPSIFFGDFNWVGGFLILIGLGLSLIGLILYLLWGKFELAITDKRVYGKVVFGTRVDLPLDSISAVGTSFLWGVDFGTSSGRIHFKFMKNKNEIHAMISNLLIERQKTKNTTEVEKTTPTTISTSNADELKKFKELLDSGIITQEEFDAKKKQLLGL